jgi:hypothetical protein
MLETSCSSFLPQTFPAGVLSFHAIAVQRPKVTRKKSPAVQTHLQVWEQLRNLTQAMGK